MLASGWTSALADHGNEEHVDRCTLVRETGTTREQLSFVRMSDTSNYQGTKSQTDRCISLLSPSKRSRGVLCMARLAKVLKGAKNVLLEHLLKKKSSKTIIPISGRDLVRLSGGSPQPSNGGNVLGHNGDVSRNFIESVRVLGGVVNNPFTPRPHYFGPHKKHNTITRLQRRLGIF